MTMNIRTDDDRVCCDHAGLIFAEDLQDDAFRRPGSFHGLFYGESVKDRADLKHASLSLAFIFLIVILFCSKADVLHPSFG